MTPIIKTAARNPTVNIPAPNPPIEKSIPAAAAASVFEVTLLCHIYREVFHSQRRHWSLRVLLIERKALPSMILSVMTEAVLVPTMSSEEYSILVIKTISWSPLHWILESWKLSCLKLQPHSLPTFDDSSCSMEVSDDSCAHDNGNITS